MSDPKLTSDREPHDPTPEQIEQRSAEVRRDWSKRTGAKRLAQTRSPWVPPLVCTIELVREINRSRK